MQITQLNSTQLTTKKSSPRRAANRNYLGVGVTALEIRVMAVTIDPLQLKSTADTVLAHVYLSGRPPTVKSPTPAPRGPWSLFLGVAAAIDVGCHVAMLIGCSEWVWSSGYLSGEKHGTSTSKTQRN
jgi:hypothetical protein